MTETSPLLSEIKKLIKSSGPIPVWRYMELCLMHPSYGYYLSVIRSGVRATSSPPPR